MSRIGFLLTLLLLVSSAPFAASLDQGGIASGYPHSEFSQVLKGNTPK